MFDIGAAELLVIVIVAVLVIGPKDMPLAMRTAGRWIGKVRKVSSHFRSGIDTMVREAELEDMEKKWKAQNEAIMKKTAIPADTKSSEPAMTGPPPIAESVAPDAGPDDAQAPDPMADDPPQAAPTPTPSEPTQSPELPLPSRGDATKPSE
ncbi:Sec-independent protein translocase protein TatB [uncultured Erythrobacter sp.]|uniref:Sec-independent protein translocase protein TatB n=1 Tax=uncultured Erythrobacter sp. TaxID=263913 RepID=UPI0026316E11|nr:Sec-independent protein translocase protein TatB [uncultured Erythrobacter sp.]